MATNLQPSRLAALLRQRYPVVQTLRRALGLAGTVLLAGALAGAPVAAFIGEMLLVTKAALAGVVLLIVMQLLPRGDDAEEHRPGVSDDESKPPS